MKLAIDHQYKNYGLIRGVTNCVILSITIQSILVSFKDFLYSGTHWLNLTCDGTCIEKITGTCVHLLWGPSDISYMV